MKEIATKQVPPEDLWKNFLILFDEVLATNYQENARGLKYVNQDEDIILYKGITF